MSRTEAAFGDQKGLLLVEEIFLNLGNATSTGSNFIGATLWRAKPFQLCHVPLDQLPDVARAVEALNLVRISLNQFADDGREICSFGSGVVAEPKTGKAAPKDRLTVTH